MQILNTFVAKIGPAGKRNRSARRKQARILAYHAARGHVNHVVNRAKEMITKIREHKKAVESFANVPLVKKVQEKVLEVPELVDFSGNWDENVAKKALAIFAGSGKSQRAFANEYNFPESRLRSWKKKLETVSI